jgi:uncharacterized RDD family membrane protein YckC
MSTAPAGWYPDPRSPGRQRYWDGAAWTEHVAPAVTAPTEATAPPPAVPGGYGAQFPAAPGGYGPRSRAASGGYADHGRPAAPVFAGGRLASWGSRVGATLLDGFLIFIPIAAGVALIFAGSTGAGVALVIVGELGALLYAPLTMMRPGPHNGQTIGKQLVGIRVVREDGRPISFGWALLREFVVKGVLFGALGSFLLYIPILLDYLWPLWDDGRQALHDKVVSTRVVTA